MHKKFKVGIIAGEESGDILGANLIKEMQDKNPNLEFHGVGAKRMQNLGLISYFSMDHLSIMGLFEVIKHLPKLLYLRYFIIKKLLDLKIDLFIGIDAPDFNLGIAKKLKNKKIKTIHYVSPSVWAWRSNRIHSIKKSVDLVLCLFPFETDFYKKYKMNAQFVGHPKAREIPIHFCAQKSKKRLKLTQKKYISILPGSRKAEIKLMLPIMLEAAQILTKKESDLEFIIAASNQHRKILIENIIKKINLSGVKIHIFTDQTKYVLASSVAALVTSGTATLDTMLLKRPMVVCYKLNRLSYLIAKKLIFAKFASLPNLLANKNLVPELLQDELIAKNIVIELEKQLDKIGKIYPEFLKQHNLLLNKDKKTAANCALEFLEC